MTCPDVVYWWDADMHVRCVRPVHEIGFHRDGVNWWDDNGLRVPSVPDEGGSQRGRPAGTAVRKNRYRPRPPMGPCATRCGRQAVAKGLCPACYMKARREQQKEKDENDSREDKID